MKFIDGLTASRRAAAAAGVLLLLGILSLGFGTLTVNGSGSPQSAAPDKLPAPLQAELNSKIKHIVIIVKENRSFDTMFGRFPGPTAPPRGS